VSERDAIESIRSSADRKSGRRRPRVIGYADAVGGEVEVGSRKSEVGGQRTEGKGRKSRVGTQTGAKRLASAKDLIVYKSAYELAMEIFELSKRFPAEEKYALTSQIRRSSRSVCLNLREAWAKRRYEAHFVSKITDCDGLRLGAYTYTYTYASESENSETDSSLDFAKACGYISTEQHKTLTATCSEIGRMLGGMIKKTEAFLIPHADL
jgi:hypothetical protein